MSWLQWGQRSVLLPQRGSCTCSLLRCMVSSQNLHLLVCSKHSLVCGKQQEGYDHWPVELWEDRGHETTLLGKYEVSWTSWTTENSCIQHLGQEYLCPLGGLVVHYILSALRWEGHAQGDIFIIGFFFLLPLLLLGWLGQL
jgi:hypothetical protein